MTSLRSLYLSASVLTVMFCGMNSAAAHDSNHNTYSRYPTYTDNRDWHEDRDDRGYYYGWDRSRGYYDRDDHRNYYWNVNLSPRDREEAQRRLRIAYKDKCGTYSAAQFNDCGEEQDYAIGRRLPRTTRYWTLPGSVAVMLPRPKADTKYIWIDRDVLLVSRSDRTVLGRVISLW